MQREAKARRERFIMLEERILKTMWNGKERERERGDFTVFEWGKSGVRKMGVVVVKGRGRGGER